MKKNFQQFILSLSNSLRTWDYFVNWHKVLQNTTDLEKLLDKLNGILGKENLHDEFKKLYTSNPSIVRALPILIAVRDKKLEIIDEYKRESTAFDFEHDMKDVDKYSEFFEKSGLASFLQKSSISNLSDFVKGVEVGLSSHGRKNRTGSQMEFIVGSYLKDYCDTNSFKLLKKASISKIKKEWGITVRLDSLKKRFDFSILNQETKGIKIVETDFYSGRGTKMDGVCRIIDNLHNELNDQNIDLVWITDGPGWRKAKEKLEETYMHNKYVFNLSMLENGVLDKLEW